MRPICGRVPGQVERSEAERSGAERSGTCPGDYLPNTVTSKQFTQRTKHYLKKDTKLSTLELDDIVEPTILSFFHRQYGENKTKIVSAISPNLQSFSNHFKPETLEEDGVIFKYSPTGILAPDLPFEQATSLKLNGQYGIDIYKNIIKPQLQD